MNFDQEILRILTLAGDNGLKTEKIARHVFNSCNSMFTPLNYKDVHSYVSQFLIKNAKDPSSIIEKGSGHGVYKLNFKDQLVEQLVLKFSPQKEQTDFDESTKANNSSDSQLSLTLFD